MFRVSGGATFLWIQCICPTVWVRSIWTVESENSVMVSIFIGDENSWRVRCSADSRISFPQLCSLNSHPNPLDLLQNVSLVALIPFPVHVLYGHKCTAVRCFLGVWKKWHRQHEVESQRSEVYLDRHLISVASPRVLVFSSNV